MSLPRCDHPSLGITDWTRWDTGAVLGALLLMVEESPLWLRAVIGFLAAVIMVAAIRRRGQSAVSSPSRPRGVPNT